MKRKSGSLYLPGHSSDEDASVSKPKACGDSGDSSNSREMDYMDQKFCIPLEDSSSAHPRSGEPLGVRRKKKSTQRIEDEETPKSPTVEKTNVGFQLLTKMGYTEGKGLGKNLDGLPSAIVPEVKKHRGGVGLEEATQEKAEALIQRTKLEEEEIKKSFIKRTQGFFDTKQNFTDLCNLANAVLQLDERKGLTPRSEINLIYRLQSETEEMGNDLLELKDDAEWIQATLRELNIHARTEHHYCSFCGVAYRSTDEINRDCPGEFREDH